MSKFLRVRPNQEQLERLQKAIKKYGTQGEIILPNDYKYEEFKEWFKNQTDFTWSAIGCAFVDYDDELPFSKFEHEQKQKEKEREIKEVIFNNLPRQLKIKKNPWGVDRITWDTANNIYEELKEKDLIK